MIIYYLLFFYNSKIKHWWWWVTVAVWWWQSCDYILSGGEMLQWWVGHNGLAVVLVLQFRGSRMERKNTRKENYKKNTLKEIFIF